MAGEYISCGHETLLWSADTLKIVVGRAVKLLRRHIDQFDAIVVSGYSAAVVGPIVANRLGKNVVLVRKPESVERRHSCKDFEGYREQRCVFIDDCIASGRTVRHIYDTLQDNHCTLYGVVLYGSDKDPTCLYESWCAQRKIDRVNEAAPGAIYIRERMRLTKKAKKFLNSTLTNAE